MFTWLRTPSSTKILPVMTKASGRVQSEGKGDGGIRGMCTQTAFPWYNQENTLSLRKEYPLELDLGKAVRNVGPAISPPPYCLPLFSQVGLDSLPPPPVLPGTVYYSCICRVHILVIFSSYFHILVHQGLSSSFLLLVYVLTLKPSLGFCTEYN